MNVAASLLLISLLAPTASAFRGLRVDTVGLAGPLAAWLGDPTFPFLQVATLPPSPAVATGVVQLSLGGVSPTLLSPRHAYASRRPTRSRVRALTR